MDRNLKRFSYALILLVAIFVVAKFVYYSFLPNQVGAFEWEKQVNVYFGNKDMGSSGDCSKVFPLPRVVPNAETLGPSALKALLEGVSQKEKEIGYFSSINDGVLIQKFEVKNKVAYVDFNSRFNESVGGSCRVSSIRSQIENTLNNLPDIDSVVISVDNQTEGTLEP